MQRHQLRRSRSSLIGAVAALPLAGRAQWKPALIG
jgi:hypothetical protein